MLGRDARVKVKIRRGVDVTTHRRALLLRAGAAAVLVTGALVGATAAPAFAAANLAISASNATLTVGGGAQSSTITVRNTGDSAPANDIKFTVDIAVGAQEITMSTPGGCSNTSTGFECTIPAADLPADGSKSFTASFTPPGQSSIPAGQSRDVTGQLKINGAGGGSGSFKVTLKAPAQTAPPTQTVQEVSGTVNDSTTGKVLKGASVNMEDGAGKSRSATTDDAGRFRFLGTETNPIAPGNISISVTMNGYDAASKDVTVQAGKSATGQRLALVPIGSTASPVVPSMEESTPAGDDTQSAAPGGANTANTSSDSGGGMSSYILIALGALPVAQFPDIVPPQVKVTTFYPGASAQAVE